MHELVFTSHSTVLKYLLIVAGVLGMSRMTRAQSQGATTFGAGVNDIMRDPTPQEMAKINLALQYPNYPYAFGPQPNVRYFVFKRSDLIDVAGTDFVGTDAAAGGEATPGGGDEVGIAEDTIEKPPSELASTLDHESGHIKNRRDGKDDTDTKPDPTSGDPRVNPAGRQEHFRLYQSQLSALCGFICNLCMNGYHLESPALLCEIYKNYKDTANKDYWPHFPMSSAPPMIGECECCPCNH